MTTYVIWPLVGQWSDAKFSYLRYLNCHASLSGSPKVDSWDMSFSITCMTSKKNLKTRILCTLLSGPVPALVYCSRIPVCLARGTKRSSIEFIPGEWAGHGRTWTLCWLRKFWVSRTIWRLALPCWKPRSSTSFQNKFLRFSSENNTRRQFLACQRPSGPIKGIPQKGR